MTSCSSPEVVSTELDGKTEELFDELIPSSVTDRQTDRHTINQSINQSINLMFNVDQAINSNFKDHKDKPICSLHN